jgi:hypothetical protein
VKKKNQGSGMAPRICFQAAVKKKKRRKEGRKKTEKLERKKEEKERAANWNKDLTIEDLSESSCDEEGKKPEDDKEWYRKTQA